MLEVKQANYLLTYFNNYEVYKYGFELSPIFIPEELENVKLPSPELLSFYENLQERVIWIDDEIGDQLLQYSNVYY